MISKTAGLLMANLALCYLSEDGQIKIMGGNAPTQEGQLKKALSVQSNISHKDVFMNIFFKDSVREPGPEPGSNPRTESQVFLNILIRLI